jgi:WD40 repeat protein
MRTRVIPPSEARRAGSVVDETTDTAAGGPLSTTTIDAAPSAPSRLPLLRSIGRYQVIELIGQGGMGAVYRVRDPELDRDLAVKVVLPRRMSVAAQTRLLNEARALAKLRHPNVLPLYDVLDLEHQLALVMPFIPGGTLRDWLGARRRTWPEIVQKLCAAGRGLAAAHDAGIVHCDFKPSNVLLGEHGEALVADFGLSIADDEPGSAAPPEHREGGAPETRSSAVRGTPGYMSPEQILGEPLDTRSDQFAFAVTAWEALTGTLPFALDEGLARPHAVLALIERGPPRTAGRAPRRLLAPLRRALARDPHERWPSMSSLLAELSRYASRRRSTWRTVGAVAGIGLVALGIRAASDSRSPGANPATFGRAAVERVSTRGTVLTAAVSRDGRRLLAVEPDGVLVWDVERDVADRYIATGPTQAQAIFLAPAISPDGRHAIVLHKSADDDVPVRVDLDTGAHGPLPPVGIRFAYLDDERVAAFRGGSAAAPVIDVYDARTLSVLLRRCPLPAEAGRLLDVVVSGPYLYALARGSVRSVVQMSLDCTNARVHPVLGLAPGVGMRAPHPAGGIVILTATAGNQALHWLRPDGSLKHLAGVAPPEPIHHIVGLDARGRVLMIGGAHRWRLVELDAAGDVDVKASGQSEVAFAYDRVGARIARLDASAQGKTVRVLPYDGLRTEPSPLVGLDAPFAWALRWSPDGAWLASAAPDGVTLLHVATGERRHIPTSRATELGFLAADRLVTMASTGLIEVIGVRDHAVTTLVPEGTSRTSWLQVCPAEGLVAYYVQTGSNSGDLMLVDSSGGAPARVRGDVPLGLPFSWSEDCKLYYPGADGQIEVYDPVRARWATWGRYRFETGEHLADLWVVHPRRLLLHVERPVRDLYAVELPGS